MTRDGRRRVVARLVKAVEAAVAFRSPRDRAAILDALVERLDGLAERAMREDARLDPKSIYRNPMYCSKNDAVSRSTLLNPRRGM